MNSERARQALDEAHRAEEEMQSAFDRSMGARARVLNAQSDGRMPDPCDMTLLEAYYRRAESAAAKGLHFVALSKAPAAPPSDSSRTAKKESIEIMKVALRVLTALTEKSAPQHADLDELLSFAPDLTKLAADELACEVIQRAMKRQVHLQRVLNTGQQY